MPKQPFKPFADRNRGGQINIETGAIPQRPELFALVGKCLSSWPHVEAEMALALGALLGADNAAAMAVFQTLRRSSAQREAISEAAKASSCGSAVRELINAILNVHKSVEAERNALAHGHLGVRWNMPDAILWMTTTDYVAFKASFVLLGNSDYTDERRDDLNSRLSYYKAPDLEAIAEDIEFMGWVWSELIVLLKHQDSGIRAAIYHRLCDRPRIAQELATLRRGNNPQGPCGSPQPNPPPSG